MTAATIGNWKVEIGTNASPEVLTEIEEVIELDGFGATSELVEVTNFDTTAGEKEFIAGPAEGDEFTVTANYLVSASSHQKAIRDDKGSTRVAKVRYVGVSPERSWSFSAVILGWRLAPSLSEQNQVEYNFKVTGSITEA